MSIVKLENPILRRSTEPVEKIDQEIKDLVDLMIQTLIVNGAYGIAAPQVGVSKKITVIDVEGFFQVLLNPQITMKSEELESGVEGCLSVPGVHAEITRSKEITVKATNLDNKPITISGTGLLGRVLQHEVDHLNGTLFIDHLGEAKRNQLLKEMKRKQNSS